MRICQFVPHGAVPDVRGFAPAIVAQNFSKFLKEDTYIISATENYSMLYDKSEYGDIYRLKEGVLYNKLFKKITRLDPYPLHARAAKILCKHQVDIFHAHQLEFEVSNFRKKIADKAKIVVHAHVTRTFNPSWGVADAYIAVSEYIKNRLIERGFDERLISVVRNGVDVAFFSPVDEAKKNEFRVGLGIPIDAKVISFVGRKQEVKGYDIFLQAAEILLKKREDIFLLAVGAEPKDAQIEETYIKRQKLRSKLLKHERYLELDAMPHESISRIYQLSDIMLMPSKSETQGMAIVEAMSCGCSVISTKNSAIVESIDHGLNGFLTENRGDIDEIEQLINKALSQKSEIAINARQKILDKFAWEKVASDLKSVYTRLLS